MNTQPISESGPTPRGTRVVLFLLGMGLTLGGLAGTWFLVVDPAIKVVTSQNWVSNPCRIVNSRIQRHEDSDGDVSYSVEILYEYTVNGQNYNSTRYSFYNVSGSRQRAQRIVQLYPSGAQSTCFYNSADPTQAALDRSFSWWSLLGLLFLLLVGAGIFVLSLAVTGKSWAQSRQGRSPTTRSPILASSAPSSDDPWREWSGPQRLKPESTRTVRTVGLGVTALFWNAIVGVFVGVWVSGNAGGGFSSICLGLFLIPFIIVGFFLVGAFIHSFLGMFNAVVEIALSNGAVPIGQDVDVAWELQGKINRIQKLVITVQGTEQATYTRGTSTYTDNETFTEISVCQTTDQNEMGFGSTTITIPADSIHSFEAAHNKIQWNINIKAEIPLWPDINESFGFKVRPLET